MYAYIEAVTRAVVQRYTDTGLGIKVMVTGRGG